MSVYTDTLYLVTFGVFINLLLAITACALLGIVDFIRYCSHYSQMDYSTKVNRDHLRPSLLTSLCDPIIKENKVNFEFGYNEEGRC